MNLLKRKKVLSLLYVTISIILIFGAMNIAQITSNIISDTLSLSVLMDSLLYTILYIITAFIIGLPYAKYILHLTAADIGVKKCFPNKKWVVTGILLPVTVSAFYLIFVDGAISKNSIYAIEGEIATILSAVLVTGISAGIVEEFFFRGLIMHYIEYVWNKKVAIIMPSLLFAAAHLYRISEWHIADTILLIAAGTMVGIMFSLICYESGSIWAGSIIHGLWNIIIIGDILQITSSAAGRSVNAIYYYTLEKNNTLITGGIYGIEAALPSILGYLLISVVILLQAKVPKTKGAA